MMGLLFAVGSLCFLIGPFPGYVDLVGPGAAGVTFFVGSIFFTAGGLVQTASSRGAGQAEWRAAVIQSAGTLFFNVSTYQAMQTALSSADYDRLVWRPDAFGSICFLVSGVIAYRASPRVGRLPSRGGRGWWIPAVNLLGCVLFGISAVAGYVVPTSGSMLDLAAANWTTSLGAACFLACAVASVTAGRHADRVMPDRPAASKIDGAPQLPPPEVRHDVGPQAQQPPGRSDQRGR
jgi:YrhK-like protein